MYQLIFKDFLISQSKLGDIARWRPKTYSLPALMGVAFAEQKQNLALKSDHQYMCNGFTAKLFCTVVIATNEGQYMVS